ncbi:hypothetical protein evm_006767 [Chilo suppressalis]|nr:hypothetical protein evm_006767 [Chilo suppressalis]
MNIFRFSKGITYCARLKSTAADFRPNMNNVLPKEAAKRIVWIDMEMTGLDINKDRILEIACLITDADLNLIATGPNIVVHQPEEILQNMNSWCVSQHGASGLTEASRKSEVTIENAEKQLLDFVSAHIPENKCPLGA